MNAYSASEMIKEKLSGCIELFSSYGLLCKTEVECSTKKHRPCQPDDASCRYIWGSVSIYCEGVHSDEGYYIEMFVDCEDGEVDDEEFKEECVLFDEELRTLSENLTAADDKTEYIKSCIEKVRLEAEQAYESFRKDMRARNITNWIALGIGVAVILVAAFISALV